MRRQYTWDDFTYFLKVGYSPATKLIILINVITMLLNLMANWLPFPSPSRLLAFSTTDWIARPWSAVTYPLVSDPRSLISLLFAGFWMWFMGGSLERTWGTKTFVWFFAIISAITAFSIGFGAGMFGVPVGLSGLWMPLAGLTIAWATINPEQQIMLYFIIPLKAKYLAWFTVAVVFISYGSASPIIGMFALAGCFAGWQYVRMRSRAPGRAETPVIRLHQRRSPMNPMNWLRDYQEKKRLRKLFGDDRGSRGRDDRENWR